MSDDPEAEEGAAPDQWEALLRGQVMAATVAKFYSYITLSDQKAQGMILLNSVLVPFSIHWAEQGPFAGPASLAIGTALASIFLAIACIYPKRRPQSRPGHATNLLHFGDIAQLSETAFLQQFLPVYNDPGALSRAAAEDLHDVATRIIAPKFFWLKLAYGAFFVGNAAAVLWALALMWLGTGEPPPIAA